MSKRKRKQQKIQHRLKVTFEGDIPAVDAVCTAMIGQGYLPAMADNNLSYGEVAYRMALARKAYKLPKYTGFARLYHKGQTELAKQIREDIIPAIRGMVMAKLVAFRKHPTPKIVEGH